MGNVRLVATCLFGLEKLVGEEIDALGYKRRDTIDGRVYFEGPMEAIVRSNIHLRCALLLCHGTIVYQTNGFIFF